MTPQQFREQLGEWLRAILVDPKGQTFLNVMAALLPPFPTSEVPHLFAKSVGQREGFEYCLKMIVALSQAPKISTEPEANYGVPDKAPEAK